MVEPRDQPAAVVFKRSFAEETRVRGGRPLGGPFPLLPSTPVGELARRIRDRRVALRQSQTELAETMSQAGHAWHQTTVAKTERAEREPRYTELMALAEALDLDVHSLISPSTSSESSDIQLGARLQRLEQEQQLIQLRHDYVTRDMGDLQAQRNEMAQRLRELDREISAARKAYEASKET